MDKKLLKHYKSTFTFGTSVSYTHVLHREYGWRRQHDHSKIWTSKECEERTGVVAGWRWLSNGVVVNSGNYSRYPTYMAAKSIFVIEVKRGMMNRVDLVLPELLTFNFRYCIHPKLNIPIIPGRLPIMTEKSKTWLRQPLHESGSKG